MAEFASIPNMLPALNADHYPGTSCESQQGYHDYGHPQRGQPRCYPGFNLEEPALDLRSIDPTPQSGFDQCFSPNTEENKYPESSTHGWNGREVGRVNSYHYGRSAGHSPDYLYPRYDYVYSQGVEPTQNQVIASGSHTYQQPYYFYNGIPMSGPSTTVPPSLLSMTYENIPFTADTSNQRSHSQCSTHSLKSSLSPRPIKEEPSLSIPPLDPPPESPPIQCTFSYYQPPRPSEKKSPVKKKKPAMACLFCRVRKIACTPPVPGSAEMRCNQCARRDINCEYPKESKRGQYRRLQYLERVGKEVAEKIAEVERQSSTIPASDRKKGVRRLSAASRPY